MRAPASARGLYSKPRGCHALLAYNISFSGSCRNEEKPSHRRSGPQQGATRAGCSYPAREMQSAGCARDEGAISHLDKVLECPEPLRPNRPVHLSTKRGEQPSAQSQYRIIERLIKRPTEAALRDDIALAILSSSKSRNAETHHAVVAAERHSHNLRCGVARRRLGRHEHLARRPDGEDGRLQCPTDASGGNVKLRCCICVASPTCKQEGCRQRGASCCEASPAPAAGSRWPRTASPRAFQGWRW